MPENAVVARGIVSLLKCDVHIGGARRDNDRLKQCLKLLGFGNILCNETDGFTVNYCAKTFQNYHRLKKNYESMIVFVLTKSNV